MVTRISNQELDARLKSLAASERKLLHVILEHINEVDARKLYLEMAYSSLYEYLVHECKYSGSAAMRRISAARLLREVPVVGEEIQAGSLNLSQVAELSRAIKEKEKTGAVVSLKQKSELVAAISGKTTGDAQKEISKGLDLKLKTPEKTLVQKDESVHLEITLSRQQYQQLLQCRDLAANVLLTEHQDVSLASVIGLLTEQFLGMRKAKIEMPPLKEHKTKLKEHEIELGEDEDKAPSVKINKTLTVKTKQRVFSRDKCCQFKDPRTGKICGSTFNLEIDHKQPRWANGSHAVGNLQVLCRAHNNYKYKKEVNLRLL